MMFVVFVVRVVIGVVGVVVLTAWDVAGVRRRCVVVRAAAGAVMYCLGSGWSS